MKPKAEVDDDDEGESSAGDSASEGDGAKSVPDHDDSDDESIASIDSQKTIKATPEPTVVPELDGDSDQGEAESGEDNDDVIRPTNITQASSSLSRQLENTNLDLVCFSASSPRCPQDQI